MVKKLMLGATLVLLGALVAQANTDPAPLGLEPEPIPGKQVSVEMDKAEYVIDEEARLRVRVDPGAYVYVFNIAADGEVRQIFPNWYSRDPYLARGTHTIPDRPTYRLRVTPPEGENVLQVIASSEPLDLDETGQPGEPFPLLAPDPQEGEAHIHGLVPEPTFATDWTTFTVVSEPEPTPRFPRLPGLLERLFGVEPEPDPEPDPELHPRPDPDLLPGMPSITRPGIYVWGDDRGRWNITVAGSTAWGEGRPFSVRLSTVGAFANVTTSSGAPPASVANNDRSLTWEGTVRHGWANVRFSVQGGRFMTMGLFLDTSGDGDPEPRTDQEARRMVFLRDRKVNPPSNPMVLGAPDRTAALRPSQNFRIGTGSLTRVMWRTTIEELEGRAR